MTVTDFPGLSDDDAEWVQQYLAGHAAVAGGGPATWAPYGGHSTNYGPPNPLGAGAPQPAQQPQPTPGFSITGPTRASASPSPLLRPGAANSLPLASGNPTIQDYQQWLAMQQGTQPTTGEPPPFQQPAHPSTMRFPGWPTPPASPPAGPTTANPMPARPVTPTPSTAYPASTGGANSTPQGNPSQTPRNPFALIDRQNAAATATQPGRGMQTALDLSALFGGRSGGQAQANPANAPAANAQPVSGVLAQGNNAPWWMGPFQQGVFGPSARDLAAAKARSGYQ